MKLVLSIFLSIITSLYAITFEEAIANFNSKNYVEAYDQFITPLLHFLKK